MADTAIWQDDLAEATVHSPVPVDDPSLDTVEVYSDWDYYSDDYFDDDPTIMKQQKTLSDLPRTTEGVIGKKHASKIPELRGLSLGVPLIDIPTSTFKGVIWKDPNIEKDESEDYQPGQGETVTLFEDWREAFDQSKYRDDWFPKLRGLNNRSPGTRDGEIGLQESDHYDSRYSPPPLAIDNARKVPQATAVQKHGSDVLERRHPLRKSVLVDDSMAVVSEGEDTESTDVFETTPMAVEEDTPPSSVQAPSLEQEPDDGNVAETGSRPFHQFVCVEVPSLSGTKDPPPLLETETLARRRARKPKNTQPSIKRRTRNSRKDSVDEVSDGSHPLAKRTKTDETKSFTTATRAGRAKERRHFAQRADDAVPEQPVKRKRGRPRKTDIEPQIHSDSGNTSSLHSTKSAAAIGGQDPVETEVDKGKSGPMPPPRKRPRRTKS